MKVISTAAMRLIDERSVKDFAYTSQILMESAAIHIWQKMRAYCTRSDSIVLLCGKGNNGGDGLAIARWAHVQGYQVVIIDCVEGQHKRSDMNRMQKMICSALDIPCYDWNTAEKQARSCIKSADYIVDALVGIGVRGPINAFFHIPIAVANKSHAKVYSLDVPSGLSDTFAHDYCAVRATITFTVAVLKYSCFTLLSRPYCGKIVVVPIGFPPALINATEGGELLQIIDIKHMHLPISPFSYKNKRGVVAIYAGGGDTIGAAIMAADGASAAGAGIIHLFPHSQSYTHMLGMRAEYIVHRPAPPNEHVENLHQYHALCIGPGWSIDDETCALFYKLVHHSSSGVIDADAITILSKAVSLRGDMMHLDQQHLTSNTLHGWVLTPHCAEFARLLDIDIARILQDPLYYLNICARQLHVVIVLKSYTTYIMDCNGQYAICDGAEMSLATAGSGDVLAGIISALLSQGYEPFHAAKLAVLLHLHAGITAKKRYGQYRATALAKYVGKNMTTYRHAY